MTKLTSQPACDANEKSRKTLKLEVCPECKSKLTTCRCSYNDIPVIIAVCTGFPRCNFFYWSISGNNPCSSSIFGELGKWAVMKSLEILHDKFSSERWKKAFAELRRLNRLKGGGSSG